MYPKSGSQIPFRHESQIPNPKSRLPATTRLPWLPRLPVLVQWLMTRFLRAFQFRELKHALAGLQGPGNEHDAADVPAGDRFAARRTQGGAKGPGEAGARVGGAADRGAERRGAEEVRGVRHRGDDLPGLKRMSSFRLP